MVTLETFTSYAIQPSDVYLTLADDGEHAMTLAMGDGWANTHNVPSLSIRRLMYSPPKYVTVPVLVAGDPTKQDNIPHILAWGGQTEPHLNPVVICCYASSLTAMSRALATSHCDRVRTALKNIKSRFSVHDTYVLFEDPFHFHKVSPSFHAAVPPRHGMVAVDGGLMKADMTPPVLVTPGPACREDRVYTMV